jgi:hypothetical protein
MNARAEALLKKLSRGLAKSLELEFPGDLKSD